MSFGVGICIFDESCQDGDVFNMGCEADGNRVINYRKATTRANAKR